MRDQAGNERTQTFTVTLDRIPPTATIVFPTSTTGLRRNSTLNIVLDFTDATSNSVDVTGIDVLILDANGRPVGRAFRSTFGATRPGVLRWTGRIRLKWMPRRFRIRVTVVDRAGNVGTPQEISLSIR